jgi:hypothetical protein
MAPGVRPSFVAIERRQKHAIRSCLSYADTLMRKGLNFRTHTLSSKHAETERRA